MIIWDREHIFFSRQDWTELWIVFLRQLFHINTSRNFMTWHSSLMLHLLEHIMYVFLSVLTSLSLSLSWPISLSVSVVSSDPTDLVASHLTIQTTSNNFFIQEFWSWKIFINKWEILWNPSRRKDNVEHRSRDVRCLSLSQLHGTTID